MKTVRLITCGDSMEAHMIKGRLENEGIACFLTNENFTNLLPVYNNMLGAGIQVMIDEVDYDRAREIIKDKLEPDNKEIICPNCGSTDIGLGLGKHKGFKIIAIFLSLFSAIPMGNLKPRYYCKKCKQEIK